MTLVERIQELCNEHGTTLIGLERTLKFGRGTIRKWDVSSPAGDKVTAIADYFHVSVDYLYGRTSIKNITIEEVNKLLEEQNTKISNIPNLIDLYKYKTMVPVLGCVRAGVPVEAQEDIIDYIEIDEITASHGDHFGLQVQGDSMEPKFSQGDIVVVRKQSDVETGDYAVVLVDGECATLKKIHKNTDGIMLQPLNSAYGPMFFSNADILNKPVVILGKVVEQRIKFK